jgi:hypothetical protein
MDLRQLLQVPTAPKTKADTRPSVAAYVDRRFVVVAWLHCLLLQSLRLWKQATIDAFVSVALSMPFQSVTSQQLLGASEHHSNYQRHKAAWEESPFRRCTNNPATSQHTSVVPRLRDCRDLTGIYIHFTSAYLPRVRCDGQSKKN